MSLALLVIGNGRLDYLHDTVDAALTHLPEFDHYLMVDDSGDPAVQRELNRNYPDFRIRSHTANLGMARAVQSGFDLVLSTDAEYVFWLEEDFRILRPPPIHMAIEILTSYPQVAQMLFERQCLTPDEHATGSVHGAMNGIDMDGWTLQRHIFSLNPCVIPRYVLEEYRWPEGPLGIGNEAGMTKQLLDDGWSFGVWHGQMVEHEGVLRAKNWKL